MTRSVRFERLSAVWRRIFPLRICAAARKCVLFDLAHIVKTYGTAHKRVALCGLAYIALTGCATTRYAPTYCLAHNQALPAEPPKVKDQLTGDASKDVGILAGSAIRLRAWGEGLQIVLEGCREPSR